jgi:hypothetical protein
MLRVLVICFPSLPFGNSQRGGLVWDKATETKIWEVAAANDSSAVFCGNDQIFILHAVR